MTTAQAMKQKPQAALLAATHIDEEQLIGSKSVFTPEFQKQLFEHVSSDDIVAIEMLLRSRAKPVPEAWEYPAVNNDMNETVVELAALHAAYICCGMNIFQARQVFERAQSIIEHSSKIKIKQLRSHPLSGE